MSEDQDLCRICGRRLDEFDTCWSCDLGDEAAPAPTNDSRMDSEGLYEQGYFGPIQEQS